jgi:trk system potassium uptake protein TrkA
MKSILIIGLGRFGRHMAKKLIEEGNSVLAVEQSEARADAAVDFINNIEIGDATSDSFIKSLGVGNFDICVVAIGDNFQSALETTVLLKDNGAEFIIARARREVHRKLLLRNGADQVVYTEKETAERLAVKYGAKNVFDYIEMTDDVAIYEIAVPDGWVGKTIIQKNVRAKHNVSILATKRNGLIYPIPAPDHVFLKDETLIVLAEHKVIRNLTR